MEINRARFYNLVNGAAVELHERFNIGTYREKKLHAILKKYFEDDPAFREVPTCGFIADIRRGEEITEIETSGFSGLGPKLSAYLPEHRVTLVRPLAGKKSILWIDPETKEISGPNRSPKKEGAYDLLAEMVRILPFVADKNLTVLGPVLEVREYRLADGWGGKRGSHRYERIPVDLTGMIEFSSDADYRSRIPGALGESFRVRDFAAEARIREDTARAAVRVMETRGVLRRVGKDGRFILFGRC